jgi:hypothetical protein
MGKVANARSRRGRSKEKRATQSYSMYLNMTQRASIDVAAHGVRACGWFGGGWRDGGVVSGRGGWRDGRPRQALTSLSL